MVGMERKKENSSAAARDIPHLSLIHIYIGLVNGNVMALLESDSIELIGRVKDAVLELSLIHI